MRNAPKYCCENMEDNIENNNLVFYSEKFDEYGIVCIEDGCSYVLMEYCPWCGKKLPASKREEWFEELAKLGFEEPLGEEEIPDKYKSGEWRKVKEDL